MSLQQVLRKTPGKIIIVVLNGGKPIVDTALRHSAIHLGKIHRVIHKFRIFPTKVAGIGPDSGHGIKFGGNPEEPIAQQLFILHLFLIPAATDDNISRQFTRVCFHELKIAINFFGKSLGVGNGA